MSPTRALTAGLLLSLAALSAAALEARRIWREITR